MTPQELAVIQAAIGWRNSLSNTFSAEPLTKAVDALIYSCHECNAGGHTCPGDGSSIPHGASDCGEHITESERLRLEKRRAQERHLAELVLETSRAGWLDYADWLDDTQVKVTNLDDDVMRVTADAGRGDVIGDFEVTVTARKLPPPGPEDDGALRAEEAAQDELIWVPRTWQDVRTGDRVRMPGSAAEAHVAHAVHQRWHVDPRTGTSSFNPARAMEWECVHVVLTDRAPDSQPIRPLGEWDMDPVKPVEIQISRSEIEAMEAVALTLGNGDDPWRMRAGLIETHIQGSMPGDNDE